MYALKNVALRPWGSVQLRNSPARTQPASPWTEVEHMLSPHHITAASPRYRECALNSSVVGGGALGVCFVGLVSSVSRLVAGHLLLGCSHV